MGERRFVLQEIMIDGAQYYIVPSTDFVSEAELKRRLVDFVNSFNPRSRIDSSSIGQAHIDFIIHGEREKEEESPAGLFHGPGLPKKDFDLFNECAAHNKKRPCPICEVPQDKPSPTPTRQEWEEWADTVAAEIWPPMIFEGRDGDKKRASTKTGILSMPIVPKEKK